jgi:hypothetical protein
MVSQQCYKNRRIAGYATVFVVLLWSQKTSQDSDIIKSLLLSLVYINHLYCPNRYQFDHSTFGYILQHAGHGGDRHTNGNAALSQHKNGLGMCILVKVTGVILAPGMLILKSSLML